MTLTNCEQQLTEHLVAIIDIASRVLEAAPGSHYQWDKAQQLAHW